MQHKMLLQIRSGFGNSVNDESIQAYVNCNSSTVVCRIGMWNQQLHQVWQLAAVSFSLGKYFVFV